MAAEKLTELLAGLLNQPTTPVRGVPVSRRAWDPRKALLCVPEANRESVALGLTENGYQVFVAQDTRQAVDRMREHGLDVVLLDSRFDPSEQGAIFVTREVNILRPPQRRRLFFVLISPSLRTMDPHAAFLSNVNAIVNVNELEELPKLLERRIREYNEIYREFNVALNIPTL
jgi:CheY-like chemotaxis protein